jgi:RimJ/RimL family protein N-acetyltransferase
MAERPTVHTARLVLRPFLIEDAPDVARLAGDREIASTTLLIPHPYKLEHAVNWISGHEAAFESGQAIHFAICLRTTDQLLGAVGLVLQPEHDRAEIGYWIGKPFWGNGYATEAAAAATGYAFSALRYNRVFSYHYSRNPASGRVLSKIGMRHDGCQHAHIKKWGVYEDCEFYGILRAEWESGATAPGNRP